MEVLSRGPWTVGGALFILKKWEVEDNLTPEEPKHMPIWVNFFGIPVEYEPPRV